MATVKPNPSTLGYLSCLQCDFRELWGTIKPQRQSHHPKAAASVDEAPVQLVEARMVDPTPTRQDQRAKRWDPDLPAMAVTRELQLHGR